MKNKEAVKLGQRRWESMSDEQKKEHIQRMVDAHKRNADKRKLDKINKR